VVKLRVLVSEEGVPVDVAVVERARGHLTEAASDAVRRWRFQPAVKAGRPVAAWTTVEIPFEAIPYPTAVAPSASPTPPSRERRPFR
jgi:protein TonB